MVKGRNTAVLSIRVSDELAQNLRIEAKKHRETVSEYIKLALEARVAEDRIQSQAIASAKTRRKAESFIPDGGRISAIKVDKQPGEEKRDWDDNSPPDLKKYPDYWKDPEPKQVVSLARKYPGTARSAPCPCGSGKKYKRCHGA